MATDNVVSMHTHALTIFDPLGEICKGFRKNVACLLVGPNVTEVRTITFDHFCEPVKIKPVCSTEMDEFL